MTIKFVIPGEPCGKGRPRFVRATGRTYTPEKTANYENLVKVQYMAHAEGAPVCEWEMGIRLVCYYGIPKSVSQSRRDKMRLGIEKPTKKPDCDNILKVVCDALNHTAYRDDSQIVYAEVIKMYGETPMVEVTLWEI